MWLSVVAALAGAMLSARAGHAANPRWVTGWPYFQNNDGLPVAWYTTQLQYYTDPGDLSATVNHATADALVAAAAAVWNNSMSSLVLGQGGALNEDVSGANVYLGPGGPVFPSDVQATNYLAKPIAVIYDVDGSVTDTLLGGGASDPGNCRQSAVTESVDSIAMNGQIQHALIVLNGRCVSAAAATQQEMKYRLVRAFGRVLGLGWSQLNDNVFTGVPQATSQQVQNWPVMHPIDVLCGTYAYQCMLNPFTLRTDDLASLITLYPVTTAGNGKTPSYANATRAVGWINFGNQQGMEGVLVSLRRFHFGPGYSDAYDLTSAVSGMSFQQTGGSPVTPKTNTLGASLGSTNTYYEGYYSMGWVPVPTADYFDNFTVTTSAINPLYTGQYAVGPYPVSQATPSGPAMTGTAYVVNQTYGARIDLNADGSANQAGASGTAAPTTCGAGMDGTVYAPAAVPSSGFWTNVLCGYQHTAWSNLAVKAGRMLTMEVTAVDEQGYATTGKMLPVLGVWDSGDPAGSAPTIAEQAAGLNASTLGMTNLIASTTTARTMRMAVADQRGDGRPDYGYKARVLYADAVSPAALPANGGLVTIAGMGFRAGNAVTVNGVAANVTGWTSTAITLVAPAITGPLAADVVVTDLSTGGQTRMTGALSYSATAQPDVLSVVSKPADGGYVGTAGSPVFKVQVMLPDGVTPASGVAVTFSSAKATFGACSGASTCVLTSDAEGSVSSAVTATMAGTVTLSAGVGSATVAATFVALALPVDMLSVVSLPSGTVYATLPAATPFRVQVTLPDGATADAGAAVVVTATNAGLGACSGAPSCTLTADGAGRISTTVTPLAAGVVSLLATAGGGMVSASFGATTLPADVLHVVTKPADGAYVGRVAAVPFAVRVMLGDDATPASGASVTVSAVGGTLTACGGSSCVVAADAGGVVSTTVTPTAAGTVTLTASAGGGTVTATFMAVVVPPDGLTVVTKPLDGSYVGRVAAVPFAVRVVLGDTGAAASGVSVTLSAVNGVLGVCGAATCVVAADAGGMVSTMVTPTAAGTVTLTASAGGGTVTAAFMAVVVPPDGLTVVTKPLDGSYVGRVAAVPFAVRVVLGDTGAAAAGVSVTLSAVNGVLGVCGAATCVVAADAGGMVSTMVTPTAAGTVTLTASAGGGSVSATFNAVVVPPDALHVVTQPVSGAYVGRVAALPFSVQVARGDTGVAAIGTAVTVVASNATLGACGAATCVLTADASGSVSTTVTPSAAGAVTLTAAAGGGSVSATFNAVVVPPDTLQVVTQPANGSYVGRAATLPFSVQALMGDTGGPASGVSFTLTASNGTLGCGSASCVLTADASGSVSTTVTPSAAGAVTLTAAAGGGSVSATFNAVVVPPDTLQVVTQPANGSYVGRAATLPFSVQALMGDTGGPASGVSFTLTASNGTLGCGSASCVAMANAGGTVSTAVTPTAAGTVTLTANAGGGMATVSFQAVAAPPDSLRVITSPADNTLVGSAATLPFSVSILLGDGVTPAANVPVTVTAAGATFGVCGLSTCAMTTDGLGAISTTVTATAAGTVTLTAAAGGGSATSTFAAIRVPLVVQVVSAPLNGSYTNQAAAGAFTVKVLLGSAVNPQGGALHGLAVHALVAQTVVGGPAVGEPVTMSAVGATLGACGLPVCVVIADGTGTASTTVTPILPGAVTLVAAAGGVTANSGFTAAAAPDVVRVTMTPSNGSYVNRSASPGFAVQVMEGDGVTPAAGVAVTMAATGATLNVCGLATCVVTADSLGRAQSLVSPTAVGTVGLSAGAGGGTAGSSFTAVAVPPDSLSIVSQPASGAYAGRVAAGVFAVQAVRGDMGGFASGTSVTMTAVNATLGACGSATCVLVADGSGTVSSTVTPLAPGLVTLSAAEGGGSVSASFNAVAVPADTVRVQSRPADGAYVQRVAGVPFSVQVLLGDTGGVAAGIAVSVGVTNGTLPACGGAACILTTDTQGYVSSGVVPTASGPVTLTASAGGGSATASFMAANVPVDLVHILSQPADGSYVGRVAAMAFQVQAQLGDTGAPAAGAAVTLTAVSGTLGACGLMTCVLTADAAGEVSTTVTPLAAGTVTLTASVGGGSASGAFRAVAVPPNALQVVSRPADGATVGVVAVSSFALRVLLGDTGGAAAGASVTLSASNATLGACGGATCVLVADSAGTISTTVTPTTVGAINITATSGGGTVTIAFNAAPEPPDSVRVVSQPTGSVYVGLVAATPFTVQVLLPDGSTPAAGLAVVVSAGNATLGGCAGGVSCVLTANGTGEVSTTVTPQQAGMVSLQAAAGGGSVLATFAALALPADVLSVVSAPGNGVYVEVVAGTRFAVRVLLGDGVTPAAGAQVTLSATGASLVACGAAVCTLTADATGVVWTPVTPMVAGTISVTATAGGGSVTASFAVTADAVRVVSVPADRSYTGAVAATRYAVQVLLGDGVTPAAGASVTVTAVNGRLQACGSASCVLIADASGVVSTGVTPTVDGLVTLSAAAGGGSGGGVFTAVAAPDVLRFTSLPANGSFTGRAAAQAITVRVLLADGVTAAGGVTVTLSVSNGTLGVCGLARCIVAADANGIVSTSATPQAAGIVAVTAAGGDGTVSGSFQAVDPVRALTMARATEFVAAGATVAWSPVVTVLENGVPVPGVAVTWSTSSSGLVLAAASTVTNAGGAATVEATIAALGSGAGVSGQVCAWGNVCSAFGGQAVDASMWRLTAKSGGVQSVGANDMLRPVVVQATDAAGDVVAGVPIAVHQTVRGWVTCPASGRCPTGPMLTTGTGMVVTDADGEGSMVPLEVAGTAETTQIVGAAGANGYVSMMLSKMP